MFTIHGLLGLHDLVIPSEMEDIDVYNIIRGNHAGFEDCIQFAAQSHNSFAIGGTFNAIMLISPLLSIHGITTKFQIEKVISMTT